MDDVQIAKLFEPLFSDIRPEDSFPKKTPLLAHYTSIPALEAILRTDEIWLSNPLFMNDLEEVRFGIEEGASLFRRSPEIESSCGNKPRLEQLRLAFEHYYKEFANDHALDTYVFCLSEHNADDSDGLLSMWRGYGGNGNGAAIVFDTAKIPVRQESPLVVANVTYATTEERRNWLQERIVQFAGIIKEAEIPDDKLYIGSFHFFQRLKMFAIFTKHLGFKEEHEWRLVYMRDRDQGQLFDKMFSYWIGPRGVEPKLKLNISSLPGYAADELSLSKFIKQIILGPSISTLLARATILKMLAVVGKPDLKERTISSAIPFRGD